MRSEEDIWKKIIMKIDFCLFTNSETSLKHDTHENGCWYMDFLSKKNKAWDSLHNLSSHKLILRRCRQKHSCRVQNPPQKKCSGVSEG